MIKVSVFYPNSNGSTFDMDSVDAFQQAWGPHAEAIVADVPNYTNTQPTIQLSEVRL